jgi:hypothetical protein
MKKKKLILAIVRHIITFVGGTVVATDTDPELVNEAIGGIIATIGAILSIVDKLKGNEDK